MSDTIITPTLSVDEDGDLRVSYENCCDYVGYTDEYTVVRLDSAQRRALIDHLLAIEVAERVYSVGLGVIEDSRPEKISFSCEGQRVDLFRGGYVSPAVGHARTTATEELEALVLCLTAALFEKRRREATDAKK